MNVGLVARESFAGGDLLLGGVRGQEDAEEVAITPDLGVATFHLGRRLHAVDKVLEGERRVLICWCRSMSGVRSRVCPCCWMNRRMGRARTRSAGHVSPGTAPLCSILSSPRHRRAGVPAVE